MRTRRRFALIRRAALVAVLAGLAGCREDWQAATYPTSGRLSINGRPAAGALIELEASGPAPDVRNSRPWGKVDAEGNFQLATYQGELGAPPGEYRVAITWPVDASVYGSPDRLGGKLAQVGAAGPTVTIRAEPTVIPPIELTGIKVTANPRASATPKALRP